MGTSIEAAQQAPMTHEGDIAHIVKLAEQLAHARGMLPKHLTTPGEIVAVLLTGRELGLAPMASIRGLYLVHGKVGASYDTMIGLLRRSGYRIEWPESGPTKATLKLTHPDGSTHTETWDEARARKANLWGNRGPWSQYPETMLRARCVSSAGRAFAGDVLAGVYTTDEAREIAAAKGVPGPAAEAVEAEVVESHPVLERLESLADRITAEELSADDARSEVWAAKSAVDEMSGGQKSIAWRAIKAAAAAAGCAGKATEWATEPPPDGEGEEEITDAEFTEEVA